jgi:hypothetical protein
MSQIANPKYGEVNVVDVDVYVDGSWIGYGAECDVTTPALTPTRLITSQCGITLTSLTTILYANAIYGASQYKFKVTKNIVFIQ